MKSFTYLLSLILVLFSSCEKEVNALAIESLFFDCYDPERFGPLSPDNYAGLPTSCKSEVLIEHFDNNDRDWYERSDNNYLFEVKGSHYDLRNEHSEDNFYINYRSLLDHAQDFELEVDIRYLSAQYATSASLNWGGLDGFENLFFFGLLPDQRFVIGWRKDNQQATHLIPPTPSTIIKNNAFNTLSIRYFRGIHYFFINEKFVAQLDNIQHFGNEMGFRVPRRSHILLDNLMIRSLQLVD